MNEDNFIYSFLKKKAGVLMGLFLMCLILTFLTDKFLQISNIINVLRQISINLILAFGMTYAIIICGIDLSVGSIVAVSGTFACGIIQSGISPVIAILIGLLIGTSLGFFNGFIIANAELPPFIVTLGMMTIARGLAYVYSGGKPIRSIDPSFNWIGNGYIGPIPIPVIIMLFLFAFTVLILNKTRFGRYVYAVGGNREAARYSGINIKMVEMRVYTICGFLAAISGIILSARLYSGVPTIGAGYELDAIAAAVLGGTSFSGGAGTIGGTFIGALIIGVLNNGMNLLNVPYYYQLIVKGLVILSAVYIDSVKNKIKLKEVIKFYKAH